MLINRHLAYTPDLWIHQPHSDRTWSRNEFAQADLGDDRLNQRLVTITELFSQQPLANIPQACGNWARSKGAYRFFSNEKVSFAKILKAHQQSTCERMNSHAVVLCPQDTTSLNYTPHMTTRGLGPIGKWGHTPIGFLVHSTVAVTPEGEMLGVLAGECWARPPRPKRKSKKKKKHRNQLPLSKKESQRWLNSFRLLQTLALRLPTTTLISMGDREADLYDLLGMSFEPGNRVGLLVRMQHDRRIESSKEGEPKKQTIFKTLAGQPLRGKMEVIVPRQGAIAARQVTLEIRFMQVTLLPPRLKSRQEPLTVWAIEAREVDPPMGETAICWRLISSLPVETLRQAIEMVQWYTCRWVIEELHRVLKSGCKVESRQLGTRERLERVLAVDMVVAWKVLSLSRAARYTPEAPANGWLRKEEWQALCCYRNEVKQAPEKAPTIREATRWIACLGGFLDRTGDGDPGPMVIWRGLHRLKDITESWLRFGNGHPEIPSGPKKPQPSSPKSLKRCG